jgi:hypothetical protein
MTHTTHNPFDETYRVSRLRENLTSGSDGEGLETDRSAVPRQSFTRQVFFKQIKQTLQICDFLGHSKQAIRWQLWSALLLYVLLRFQAWQSDWPYRFTRLFTMIRSVVWDRFDLSELLRFYGTAHGINAKKHLFSILTITIN